jgi:IS30 family transposase
MKRKRLTPEDMLNIRNLLENEKNVSRIANQLTKPRETVRNYVNSLGIRGVRKKVGRPSSTTARTDRAILRLARNKRISCTKIKEKLKLKIGKTAINNPYFTS